MKTPLGVGGFWGLGFFGVWGILGVGGIFGGFELGEVIFEKGLEVGECCESFWGLRSWLKVEWVVWGLGEILLWGVVKHTKCGNRNIFLV